MTDGGHTSGPDPVFARDAARLRLREMLSTKQRGDRISAAEIVASTGFDNWRSFSRVIRAWGREVGYALHAVPNDGWRIVLPIEHFDEAEACRQAARRKDRRGLAILVSTPITELDDAQIRKHEFALIRTANRVQTSDVHDREIKREFKITERNPLPQLTTGTEPEPRIPEPRDRVPHRPRSKP
jgi:hypothetical protein